MSPSARNRKIKRTIKHEVFATRDGVIRCTLDGCTLHECDEPVRGFSVTIKIEGRSNQTVAVEARNEWHARAEALRLFFSSDSVPNGMHIAMDVEEAK